MDGGEKVDKVSAATQDGEEEENPTAVQIGISKGVQGRIEEGTNAV